METKFFKGSVRRYNPETQEVKTRSWRRTFTEDEVKEWMDRRKDFMLEVNEFDAVTWGQWHDGCYRMVALRKRKKSRRNRTLKADAVIYVFNPVQG